MAIPPVNKIDKLTGNIALIDLFLGFLEVTLWGFLDPARSA
jgi:hypothetical protein